jgi:hypothetical protein
MMKNSPLWPSFRRRTQNVKGFKINGPKGRYLCRYAFFRVPVGVSDVTIQQQWTSLSPTAVLTTASCLKQLEAIGLLDTLCCCATPGSFTAQARGEQRTSSVQVIAVDAIPVQCLASQHSVSDSTASVVVPGLLHCVSSAAALLACC